jgi:hypothetical protein
MESMRLKSDQLKPIVPTAEPPAEGWPTLEAFAEWFCAMGFPMQLPQLDHQRIFCTDSSKSFVWFRHGCYQAEMYMFHPNQNVPRHSHPMEQVFIPLAGHCRTYTQVSGGTEGCWRPKHSGKIISKKLPANYWHKLKTTERGLAAFVLQKFPEGYPMVSAAVDYDGAVTGDEQRRQKELLGRPAETPPGWVGAGSGGV